MADEENKAIARAFLVAMAACDTGAMRVLGRQDMRVWIMGYSPISEQRTIDAFLGSMDAFAVQVHLPFEIEIDRITAEDGRVVVECASAVRFLNGHVYRNHYSYAFTIEDGRIAELREYTDTAAAMESFAKLAAAVV